MALAPLSIDAYLPSLPDIAQHYGVDMVAVNLTMTSYLIGNAIGQFFGGALSDQLGRKPIGLIGLGVFLVSSILICFSPSIETMQILRLSQALGGGFSSVVCMAKIRDIYPPEQVGKKFAMVIQVVLLAPLFAPMLGAGLMQFGWQAIFIFLSIYAIIFIIIYWRLVPETRPPSKEPFSFSDMFSNYGKVITHKINGRLVAIRYILLSAFNAGIFMSYLTNASFIYMQHLGLNEFMFAIIFGAGGLAMLLGNISATKMTNKKPPIVILKFCNSAQLLLLVGITLLTAFQLAPIWLIVVILALSMMASGAIMPTAAGVYIGFFNRISGSASSLNSTAMFLIGSIIGALAAIISGDNISIIFAAMVASAIISRLILSTIKH